MPGLDGDMVVQSELRPQATERLCWALQGLLGSEQRVEGRWVSLIVLDGWRALRVSFGELGLTVRLELLWLFAWVDVGRVA